MVAWLGWNCSLTCTGLPRSHPRRKSDMSLHSVPVSSHGQINGFIADKTQTNQSRLAPHHTSIITKLLTSLYSENDWFQDWTVRFLLGNYPSLMKGWRDDGVIKCQECGHPMNDSIQNLAPWCAGGEQVWRVGDGQVLITNIDLMMCSRNMTW